MNPSITIPPTSRKRKRPIVTEVDPKDNEGELEAFDQEVEGDDFGYGNPDTVHIEDSDAEEGDWIDTDVEDDEGSRDDELGPEDGEDGDPGDPYDLQRFADL